MIKRFIHELHNIQSLVNEHMKIKWFFYRVFVPIGKTNALEVRVRGRVVPRSLVSMCLQCTTLNL